MIVKSVTQIPNCLKENGHMALKDFEVDIVDAEETPFGRSIRSQLRLSAQWIVLGMDVHNHLDEYSDEYPDLPDIPKTNDYPSIGESFYYVTYRHRRKAHKCPKCGADCKVLCYEKRCYHHLPDKGYACYLFVNLPKYKCDCCGGTPQQRFPAAFERKSYTRQLAYNVIQKLKTCTRSATAKCFGISTDVVDNIVRSCVSKGVKDHDLSYVTGVFMDEKQAGHGSDYLTVFLDQFHKVIFMYPGRKEEVLDKFRDFLIIQGGNPELIMFFSADMCVAFETGITKHFPNATLVFDRFHLVKSVNDALNNVRKRVLNRKPGESLKSVKYVVLTRGQNQTKLQSEKMEQIRLSYPELAVAYDMKEAFCYIVKISDPMLMKEMLTSWFEWVHECGPDEFVKKAEFFESKIDRILAWTKYKVSNSVSEGVNKNIEDIRRQACGYSNTQNLIDMILIRQGNLTMTF